MGGMRGKGWEETELEGEGNAPQNCGNTPPGPDWLCKPTPISSGVTRNSGV